MCVCVCLEGQIEAYLKVYFFNNYVCVCVCVFGGTDRSVFFNGYMRVCVCVCVCVCVFEETCF